MFWTGRKPDSLNPSTARRGDAHDEALRRDSVERARRERVADRLAQLDDDLETALAHVRQRLAALSFARADMPTPPSYLRPQVTAALEKTVLMLRNSAEARADYDPANRDANDPLKGVDRDFLILTADLCLSIALNGAGAERQETARPTLADAPQSVDHSGELARRIIAAGAKRRAEPAPPDGALVIDADAYRRRNK